MKKKLWSIILIIALLLCTYKIYDLYSNKKLMDTTNSQLTKLLKPFVDNTVVVIHNDKYILRTKYARLSDNVKVYKNSLNTSAYITFDIYKNEVDENNLFDTRSIYMEVWRKDSDSEFFTNGIGQMINTSYKQSIFNVFKSIFFDDLYDEIKKSIEVEKLNSEYSSQSGYSVADEDKIEFNDYGQITSKGKVHYESIVNAKGLSLKATTTFYIEDFQKYNEMNINIEKEYGDYHALWDLKIGDIKNFNVYYDNGGNKTITNKKTIENLVTYLKSIPFELSEEQVNDYKDRIFIEFNYKQPIIVNIDKECITFDNAICIGEEYVNRIVEILKEDKK